jgi:TolA-binding protein
MAKASTKQERALAATRDDIWGELQHRRVKRRIDEALAAGGKARRPWLWAASAMAVATACAAAWLTLRGPSGPALAASGAALGSDVRAASAMLADGSLVDIARGGRIRIVHDRPEETRVEVVAGRAEFEVQKRPGRQFVTTIQGVEVRVVGTHFSTELDLSRPPGLVRVAVQRGIVEVRAAVGDRVARLSAGDTLEIWLGTTPSVAASSAAPSPAVAPPAASSAAPPAASSAAAGSAAPAPVSNASKLFEAAREARRSGNVQAAVSAYAALIKQFPGDERVGVAALELGRLRMDTQHAYGSAAEAFRRAIAAAPNDGIREDALARLIEALDSLGDRATCLQEQRRYQARYPRGVHASSVRGRCVSKK